MKFIIVRIYGLGVRNGMQVQENMRGKFANEMRYVWKPLQCVLLEAFRWAGQLPQTEKKALGGCHQ